MTSNKVIDLSPLGHAGVSVSLQLAAGLLLNDWLLGAAVGCAFFLAREHTQAEYSWIAKFGGGKRSNMPWWGGFDIKAWDIGSVLDWITPLLACSSIYFVISF